MKKILLAAALFAALPCLAAQDFSKADAAFSNGEYAECRAELEALKPQAQKGAELAGVLWRLSRLELVLGEKETTRDGKRAVFGRGRDYAEAAIKQDPSDPNGYMWHSANVGRECQTHGLKDQAAAVPVMMKDLEKILCELGYAEFSEAWQALAEIYYNHPFKSTDSAINFARRAAMTIPAGEKRSETLIFLAEVLESRGWSAEKRAASASKSVADTSDNIEKYSRLDALLGKDYRPLWASKPLGAMSDKEEAAALRAFAR